MTNHTTRRHQELRLPIGLGADGKPFHLMIGYLLETDWGKGQKSYDVELCTSHLQPVIYQQVRGVMPSSATVVCDKADFNKRYKSDAPVKAPTEAGETASNDPNQGHE